MSLRGLPKLANLDLLFGYSSIIIQKLDKSNIEYRTVENNIEVNWDDFLKNFIMLVKIHEVNEFTSPEGFSKARMFSKVLEEFKKSKNEKPTKRILLVDKSRGFNQKEVLIDILEGFITMTCDLECG